MTSTWDTSWPLKPTKQLTHDDYTIAWLCALPIEKSAARNMLDELHVPPPQPEADKNIYQFGSVFSHNVVIVCQGDMGSTATTVVATRMDHTFRKLRFGLLVGIGAGVPDYADVRLGDVVISKGNGKSGGVVSHDRGKITSKGFDSKPFLNGVPETLRNAFAELESRLLDQDNNITTYVSASCKRNPRFREFARPTTLVDDLYLIDYPHVDPEDRLCAKCDADRFTKAREERQMKNESQVFFGTVASGNQVIKDGKKRAEIAATNRNILAIEMEAAGLMDIFGCATIRGICDYADSHKNDGWHRFAAGAAAAVAKETLGIIPVAAVSKSTAVPVAAVTGNEHWIIPRHINPYFTGRKEILKVLKEQLCPPDSEQKIPEIQRRFVIYGIGGSGKSEVCIKFAEENREVFWGIFWIDCSSVKTIKESFANVSKRCNIGEDFEQAKIWLENAKQPWLLILDNADDPHLDYSKYMPSGNRGCILMSTRNPECKDFSSIEHDIFDRLDFEKLDFDDAVILLLKSTGVPENRWDEQRQHAKEVVSILDQHALAIINSGAFIRERFCKLKDYPVEFGKQRQIMLKHHPKQATSTYGGVYATFAASTGLIIERALSDPAYLAALELFDVLGYMHFNGILPKIWERAVKTSEEGPFDDSSDDIDDLSSWHKSFLPTFLRPKEEALTQKVLLRKAINILTSFSLVNEQDTGVLSMHPLAHAWARDRPGPQDQIQAWTRATIILTFSKEELTYDIFWRKLHLHVLSCMQEYPKTVWSTYPPLEVARAIYSLCYLLYRESDYAVALNGLYSIQEHFKPVKGSLNWMRLQNQIAECLGELEQNQQELLLREEMEVFNHTIADEILRWTLESNLGICYWRNKQYEKAKKLLKKVIRERRRAKQDETDEEFLDSLHNLALVYNGLGRHRKALKLRDVIVKGRTIILDRTHPDLLASRHNLGVSYLYCGMPTKAIEIFQDVLEIQTEVLRPTDENLLKSQHELARAYAECGVYDKAIELMEIVVNIYKQILNPTHNDRILSEEWLAHFYLEINSFSKAVECLEEVVRIKEQLLVSSDFDVLEFKTLLGRAYLGNHTYTEAISVLKAVHEINLEKYDKLECHQFCLTTRWYLSITYCRTSRKEDTLKLLEEIVVLLKERMEPTSPERQDFERLLERCQDDTSEPLGSEFEEHRDWMWPEKTQQREELSDCSSISSEEESLSDDFRETSRVKMRRRLKKLGNGVSKLKIFHIMRTRHGKGSDGEGFVWDETEGEDIS